MDALTAESTDALDHAEFSLDIDGELENYDGNDRSLCLSDDMTEEEAYYHSLVEGRQ